MTIASLGCNSLNFLVGADSSRGGVEDKGVSSTVGAPAAVLQSLVDSYLGTVVAGETPNRSPKNPRIQ